MREREATESEENAVQAPVARESGPALRVLAGQLGNSAFGLARTARPGGVVHPQARALTAMVMRSPLSDAVHAAGTGPQTAAFGLLHPLNANQTSQRLRALDTADLVTLRQHIADADAADQARITSALGGLLQWTDAEATAIQALYATGTYTTTDTGDIKQTHAYALWRKRAVAALKNKPAAEKTAGNQWLAAHEAHEEWSFRGATGTEPAAEGAVPATFASLGAAPTPTFRHVSRYDIRLPGVTTAYSYRDDPVNPAYQYLTNETGVGRAGRKLSDRSDADAIFTAAGISDATVRKVMTKVSTQEGGFEAVNTYDTGYISIGFIQFISGSDGTGSLAGVLKEMKSSSAADFATYFHSLGIDVDVVGLTVVDPATGTILRGSAAVSAVMNDKRLTAVFQRAGTDSQAFQGAQVKRAKAQYYLAPQSFSVTQGAVTISGKYEDVLTSEAGKTALMDRAVQHGTGNAASTFKTACKHAITAHSITTLADLAKYEREIIPALVNRIDVLTEADLSQPPALPVAAPATPATP